VPLRKRARSFGVDGAKVVGLVLRRSKVLQIVPAQSQHGRDSDASVCGRSICDLYSECPCKVIAVMGHQFLTVLTLLSWQASWRGFAEDGPPSWAVAG
jgi:hypothetical protein